MAGKGFSGAGLDGVINPKLIPVPDVDPDALEAAGHGIKTSGGDIAQAGHDIKTSWSALEGHYSAPEADLLLAAVDPVATTGDAVETAATTVGNALITFANDARALKARLQGLKADAQAFVDSIRHDQDWREDEAKVEQHNALNNDVAIAFTEYQAAERTCANTITDVFDGTHFIAAHADGSTIPDTGEEVYGLTTPLHNTATPWATPQEHDADWWADAGAAVRDFATGSFYDAAGMVGLYSADGELGADSLGEWGTNLKDHWGQTLLAPAVMTGFHNGERWIESADEWGPTLAATWTEIAHSVVPWREWDDRPGYVITTTAINLAAIAVDVGAIVGGTALSATGPGALVGIPLAAWRGTSLLRRLGTLPDTPSTHLNADLDATPNTPTLDLPGHRPGTDPTTALDNLDTALDGLDTDTGHLHGLNDALDTAETLTNPSPDTDPGPADTPAGAGSPTPRTPAPASTTDAGTSIEATENLPTTQQIQDLVDQLHTDIEHAEQQPGGLTAALGGDRHPALAHAGGTNAHAEAGGPTPGRTPDHLPPTAHTTTGTGSGGSNGLSNESDNSGGFDKGIDHSYSEPKNHDGNHFGSGDGGSDGTEGTSNENGDSETRGENGRTNNDSDSSGEEDFDPRKEERLKRAASLENSLRDGGLTEEEIVRLRGDNPRDGGSWQRVADALGQNFNKSVHKQLHPEATRFAFEGADNPREFAYRYEYYKAIFQDEVRRLSADDPGGTSHPGQSRRQAAANNMMEMDVDALLRADRGAVLEVRNGVVRIDPEGLSADELDQAVRNQAGEINMGHETSAAYHVRKHYHELPKSETTGDRVQDYHNSMELTIHDGTLVDRIPFPGAGEKFVYQREVPDLAGRVNIMKAIVLVRSDGTLVTMTYGGKPE